MNTLPDIVLVDKPKGITSYDVIRRLKDAVGDIKMGHAGTLDPQATGLLIIGVGAGTKKLSKYIGLPKTYEAEIMLGVRTDTGDLEGEVVEEQAVERVSEDALADVLDEMTGDITLPVPLYSAVKVKGKPLYKYARAGEDVTVPERIMEIRSAAVRGVSCGTRAVLGEERAVCTADMTLDVASGTYIRSIAEEVGRRFGVPATLAALRRTRIGDFTLEDAHTIEEITANL